MNLRQNQKGFTIVELLIVVVVIAILAAISIVAYTGITNRANRSAALEAANSVKSVATAFNGANGSYPTSKAQFVAGHSGDPNNAIAKLPSDICFVTGTASFASTGPADNNCTGTGIAAGNGPKTVRVVPYSDGFRIYYFDYVDKVERSMDAGNPSGTAGSALAN